MGQISADQYCSIVHQTYIKSGPFRSTATKTNKIPSLKPNNYHLLQIVWQTNKTWSLDISPFQYITEFPYGGQRELGPTWMLANDILFTSGIGARIRTDCCAAPPRPAPTPTPTGLLWSELSAFDPPSLSWTTTLRIWCGWDSVASRVVCGWTCHVTLLPGQWISDH